MDNQLAFELLEQAMEMVLLFDCNGTITYTNSKASLLLEYIDSIIGMNITDIFPGSISIKNGQIEIKADKDEKYEHIYNSLMAYRQNKTCFCVDARIRQIGETYICMAIDTSKRDFFKKKANNSDMEAEAAQQVKTQFVANVTHELRTPVNGILGNVRELQNREEDAEKKRLLNLVERGCNDMHSIINNILDFSKLDAGKFILESRPFQFREMMDYIKSTHINKITEKGLQFFMTVSPDIPDTLVGDELRIQQILNNLLSNAVKFTYVGKIIVEVVKASQIGNKLELFFMVIDSGIGIAPENQHKLFKSFSQVEASTTRKFGGTGLGLNISKQLVELMNGSIHVESEENKGTMFSFHIWVDLPVDEAAEQNNNETVEYVSTVQIPTPSLSVLDDQDNLTNFGTKENLNEINKKMSKLILCIEMSNWEKAEQFMDGIRRLTENGPKEIKSPVLRLKMSVQKEDHDKSVTSFENLKNALNSIREGDGSIE